MIKIEIDEKELKEALNKLKARLHNLNPVMEEIGELMVSSIQENFEQQGRYSSPGSWKGETNRWKSLKQKTIEQRTRKGYWPGKILQQRGRLNSSIGWKADNDSVTVGTNLVYAAIHQFGGKAGRGHRAEIPARPYLVVQDEDLEEIKKILSGYLKIW